MTTATATATASNVYMADLLELTKPRICVLALLMTALGYILGQKGTFVVSHFVFSLLGTGLVGAGSCIFNQYAEITSDAKMHRTKNRPLPSGRLSEAVAVRLGVAMSVIGIVILLIAVNPITCVLGAATLLLYLGVYTPSKKINSLSTLIGAVPGAIPPLMGWTAANGNFSKEGFLLFGILFIWQIPHFLAIAWLYREDYGRADMAILSVIDEAGLATSKQIVLYCLALFPLTLVPTLWEMTGVTYFVGAFFLNLVFVTFGGILAWKRTNAWARTLFIVSILYLPLLGGLMVWDRL